MTYVANDDGKLIHTHMLARMHMHTLYTHACAHLHAHTSHRTDDPGNHVALVLVHYKLCGTYVCSALVYVPCNHAGVMNVQKLLPLSRVPP